MILRTSSLVALWGYEKCPDLFYGGAAGPGKTSYLLMAAVQYVQYPHYRALLLRKTYADLKPYRTPSWTVRYPGGMALRARDSATLTRPATFLRAPVCQFGYMASVRDHLRYQGAAVHFVGIDEASQIPSRQLEYLHSRIRRAIGDPIPLRYPAGQQSWRRIPRLAQRHLRQGARTGIVSCT